MGWEERRANIIDEKWMRVPFRKPLGLSYLVLDIVAGLHRLVA
jgi:hypothetical protein